MSDVVINKLISLRYASMVLIFLCLFAPFKQAYSIALHDSQDLYSLASGAMVLIDNNDIDFETVRNIPDNSFQKANKDILTIDSPDSNYWLKFTFNYYSSSHDHHKSWFLEIASTSLDVLDIYFVENGNTTSHHLGDERPFISRPVQHNNYIVDFRTHSLYQKAVYIKIKNSSLAKIPIRVWSHNALLEDSQELHYLAGICYGILLILAIYNFVSSFVIRDKSYGYLAIYILCAFFTLISYDGFARQFIWVNSHWWESRALFFWESLVIFWGIQFCRNFIKCSENFPAFVKPLYAVQFVAIITSISSIIFSGNVFSAMMVYGYSISTILFIIPALRLKENTEKINFIAAWIPLYLVAFVLIAGKFGLFGFHIGAANKSYIYYPLLTIHCILLSIALTSRYNAFKKAREQAEHFAITSLQRYKDLFLNSTAGMFETTYGGEMIFVNPTLVQMLGYESEDLLLQNKNALGADLFVEKKDRINYLRLLLRTGRVVNFEFQFKRKNGEVGWALVSSCLTNDNSDDPYGIHRPNIEGSIIDITASKERESIEKRLLEAETLANVKSELLASSSHELRTPMNAIIGFTSLLQKTNLSEKQNNYADKVRVAAKGLLRLINDILDHSKLEAGEMNIEATNFNLDHILSDVVDMFSAPFNEKGIELVVLKNKDVPVDLIGDPLRINQILINLINNAMKFTHEGHVAVKIETLAGFEDSVELYITVSDTGIGIEPDRCNSIFDPYQQADSSVTKKFGGTGLGLSVCKSLIEKMGGQINIMSTVGKGSDFMFSLHLGVQREVINGEIDLYQELADKTAFIIDSNKLTVHQYAQELSEFSIKAVSASSGEMALQRLISLAEADQYDFIIIERNLIDNSGINIIKELKNESSTTSIPIILSSKTGFGDLTERERSCGIDEFLVKPIKNNNLLKSLINLFNLDYDPPQHVESKVEDKLKGIFAGYKILLVEDNELNQELFVELLAETGIEIDVANTGVMAIENIKDSKYDLIMMDVQMPILNGIETTKIIRREHKHVDDIPILALTANALDSDVEDCNNAGMNGFVSKPIDFDGLITTLKSWLQVDNNHLEKTGGVEQYTADSAQVFDLNTGLNRLGGNKKLFYKILHDFICTYRKEEDQILQMLIEKDRDGLQIKLHSAKGISLNLGLNLMGQIAKDAEALLNEEEVDFDKIRKKTTQFFMLLGELNELVSENME